MNTNHQTIPNNELIERALSCVNDLHKFWQYPRLGLVLVNAHFQGEPLTADEIAERCEASSETVRRNLKPLINVGRVDVIKEGRRIRYVANAEWSRWTCELIVRARDAPAKGDG